jgi:hypothetical protein
LFLDSIQCIIPFQGLETAQGAAYTGAAAVQCLLLDKPGDWIRAYMGTTFQGKVIKTDVALYVSFTAQGTPLRPSGTIQVSCALQQATLQTDSVWTGDYTQYLLQWTSPVKGASANTTQNILTLTTPTLGWLFCGEPLDAATGTVTVTLPNSFSNANTAVFCVLPDERVVAPLRGDPDTRTFVASGLPGGVAATVISLTFTGDSFYLAAQNLTLVTGPVTVNLTPTLQSLAYITSYLEQL